MAQTVYRCPAAMPIETLSAWHDRQLDSAEAERVRAHIHTCPACQSYLTDYVTETRGVSQFDAPYLQDRIWRGLQQEIGQAKQRRVAPSRGVILGGLGAALAVVILFAAIAVFALDNHGHSLTVVPTGTPKATNTVAPTATVATLNVSPSQGWVSVPALSFGKAIAFSQRDPLTGYVCGNNSIGDTLQPIELSVTHNGGLTWSTPIVTPLSTSSNCTISINPTYSQDLVLRGDNNWGPGDGVRAIYGTYYETLNSGQSWTKLTLPAGDPHPDILQIYDFTWAGTTFFMSTYYFIESGNPNGLQPQHLLAKSVNGGQLEWADQNIPFNSKKNSIANMYSIGTSLYLVLDGNCVLTYTCPIAETSDQGIMWSVFTPSSIKKQDATSAPVVSDDGETLLIAPDLSIPHLYLSNDSGHTWTPSPATYPTIGTETAFPQIIAMTSDRTVYLTLDYRTSTGNVQPQDTTHTGLYRLTQGTNTWDQVTSGDINISSVSSDSSGKPHAIWRSIVTNDFKPGIEYHAP